jgi:glycosyltransferase involved in cell wall biosynthesis
VSVRPPSLTEGRYCAAVDSRDCKVGVVVPCYQSAATVGDAVRSLVSQTFGNWRLAVVDDGSTDGPGPVIEAAAGGDARVTVLAQDNAGVCAARNAGARWLRSELLVFLDADDRFCPEMLEATVGYLDDHAHVGAVYTGHRYVGDDGRLGAQEEGEWPWCRYVTSRWWVRRLSASTATTPFESIFLVAAMLPSMTVMRRSVFEEAGGWDEEFGQVCEDTELFLRIAALAPVHHLSRPLVERRVHGYPADHSDRFSAQYDKLTRRWEAVASSTDRPLGDLAAASLWFRAHRFYPMRHLSEAREELRVHRFGRAARLVTRAIGEYRPSRPPPQLWYDPR